MRRGTAPLLLLLAAQAALAGDVADADAIRAARRTVLERPEFKYGAEKPKSFVGQMWDAFADFVIEFSRNHPIVFKVVLAGMLLLLIVLVAHIIWTLRATREARWTPEDAGDLDAAMRRGDAAPFRARALEHAAAGRFDEAVRDLYAALLLTLDRRGAVSFAAHKALLDYRLEASRDESAARALELFAGTYHPGSFGRRPPDRAHFDALLAALDALVPVRS